jgi:hypothetical protein
VRKLLRARREAPGHVVVHKALFKSGFPARIVVWLLCGLRPRQLACPEITLATVHNRTGESLFERSARHLGLPCRVGRVPADTPWRHAIKTTMLLDLLRKAPATEYLLFCDADDCVIRAHPRRAIELLEESGAELLFSDSRKATFYEFMPEVRDWIEEIAPAEPVWGSYPGAGVFVARWSFLERFLEDAAGYVRGPGDPDAPRPIAWDPQRPDAIIATERFPHGVEDDEAIYRYLHPRYHPRVQVDWRSKLALRGKRNPAEQGRHPGEPGRNPREQRSD